MSGQLNMISNAVNEAFKNVYIGAARYQMDERTHPLVARIEKSTENITAGDQKITRFFSYGKNGGSGNRTDNGLMPKSGSRRGVQVKTGTVNFYGTIELTDKVIKASKNSVGSFINQLEYQFESLLKDAKDNYARQIICGDGSGVLGVCVAGDKEAIEMDASTNMSLFYEGMILDVLDEATKLVKKLDAVEVIGVDALSRKLYFEKAPTTPIQKGDVVTIQGSHRLELTGLGAVLKPNTTIYGIDRNSPQYKWMNPNIIDMEGKELDEILLQKGIDDVDNRTDKVPDFIATTHGVKRAYMFQANASKRIVNTREIKGGWKAIDFNGIDLVSDKYVPANSMYILTTENIGIDRLADWEWLEEGGKVLTRKPGTAAYEAVIAMYADMICDLVGAQVLVKNIKEH